MKTWCWQGDKEITYPEIWDTSDILFRMMELRNQLQRPPVGEDQHKKWLAELETLAAEMDSRAPRRTYNED